MMYVLAVQAGSYVTLGIIFLAQGNWRFGVTQLLLATVNAILYSGRII